MIEIKVDGNAVASPVEKTAKSGRKYNVYTIGLNAGHDENGNPLSVFIEVYEPYGLARETIEKGTPLSIAGRLSIDRYNAKDGSLKYGFRLFALTVAVRHFDK